MSKQAPSEDEFLVTDPEKHPGVVLDIPAGVKPVRLEPVGYLADTQVRCAFCRNRQRHNYGFFAVLPDGSLALCGNCCAIEIADKATVAKIRREVKRREEMAAARKDVALLATGLTPVIEILDRDWLPVEKEVYRHVRRLNECFLSVKTPKMAKLSVAAGGLRDIASAASSGPASLSEIKRKRARALDMIEEGIPALHEELAKLGIDGVRRRVECDAPVHGYCRTSLDGRSLYLLDLPSWADPELYDAQMDLHMTLPKIQLPDSAPLLEAIEVARLAGG